MKTKTKNIVDNFDVEIKKYRDIHISRFHSAFVAVSGGKIVGMTEPDMKHCILAEYLYKSIRHMDRENIESIKAAIRKSVEEKISKFGFFTGRRDLGINRVVVPYGASEIMMYAMRKEVIDSAVTVCDGAGTVIAVEGEIIQGIGARMNGLFYTSPIGKVMDKLRSYGCEVLSPEADIDQLRGVERAIELGYRNIAVTVNGFAGEGLKEIRELENKRGVKVTVLIVCATGINKGRVEEISRYADLVWSCASREIRELTGKKAILQLSQGIPVFVMSEKGLGLVSGYCSDAGLIKGLDVNRQYLVSSNSSSGKKIRMGNFDNYFSECKLPVRSRREPG